MPTAGRLAGALAFFIFGWSIALQSAQFFAESNPPDYILPLSIVVSVVLGWRVVGRNAGRGLSPAIGIGLTAAFLYVLWMTFLISFWDMIGNALRTRYRGPMEAVTDVFSLMIEFAGRMFDVGFVASIIVGALICALIAEYFGKKYP